MLSMILACLLTFNADVIETYQAKVIAISDGDTVKVLKINKQVTIRLEAIDAPEKNQAYGTKAKTKLSDLVFGKVITVKRTGEDRYGRTLAFLTVDGKNINSLMIQEGMAWHLKSIVKVQSLRILSKKQEEHEQGYGLIPIPFHLGNFEPK